MDDGALYQPVSFTDGDESKVPKGNYDIVSDAENGPY